MDLDIAEGADMVKTALAVRQCQTKQHTTLPVAAYNVSGEHAMIN